MTTLFFKKFRSVAIRHRFIEPQDHILVGVSGGVDSMVLAHLLLSLKRDVDFELSLAHVNYQMRGEESDAQEELVKDFARRHDLRCFATNLKGTFPVWGTSPKVENFQQLARDFRYHYFAEVALQIGANKVAVAHHLEDQVETILAQLLRGASFRGLGGMRAEREIKDQRSKIKNKSKTSNSIKLIRPLVTFSKEELRKYATENQVSYIEDSSNASPKYWRNRLRKELLPILCDLRPGALTKIKRFGEEMAELAAFLEELAKDWLKEFAKQDAKTFWLPMPRWKSLPKPLRLEVLHQAYTQFNGNAKNLKKDHWLRCDQLSFSSKGEGYYPLPQGIRFSRLGDNLIFMKT